MEKLCLPCGDSKNREPPGLLRDLAIAFNNSENGKRKKWEPPCILGDPAIAFNNSEKEKKKKNGNLPAV